MAEEKIQKKAMPQLHLPSGYAIEVIDELADEFLGERVHVNFLTAATTPNQTRKDIIARATAAAVDIGKLAADAKMVHDERDSEVYVLDQKIKALTYAAEQIKAEQDEVRESISQHREQIINTVLNDPQTASRLKEKLSMQEYKVEALTREQGKIAAGMMEIVEAKAQLIKKYQQAEAAIWDGARIQVSQGLADAIVAAKVRCDLLPKLSEQANLASIL